MNENEVREFIKRRRLQLLVHSCIYYIYNESIIPDDMWSGWAVQLERIQAQAPEISKEVEYYEAFKNFDHSTGYDLPITDPFIMGTARWLLRIHDNRRNYGI